MSVLHKLLHYSQGILGLKSTDLILSSYPRSGSTWIRFMLCNLISILEWDGRSVDFELLNETMPALGHSNLMEPWAVQCVPRVVKTHRRYSPVFRNNLSVGIVRDPRDVMVSYYHYLKDRKGKYAGRFSDFIRDSKHGLRGWFNHYHSWCDHWTLTIQYENLRQDVFGEFTTLLDMLDVRCPEHVVREAIRHSSVRKVRKMETVSGAKKREVLFARDGSSQQWLSYFKPNDVDYFERLREEYNFHLYPDAALVS